MKRHNITYFIILYFYFLYIQLLEKVKYFNIKSDIAFLNYTTLNKCATVKTQKKTRD